MAGGGSRGGEDDLERRAAVNERARRRHAPRRIHDGLPFTAVRVAVVPQRAHAREATRELAKGCYELPHTRADHAVGLAKPVLLVAVEPLTGEPQAPVLAGDVDLEIVAGTLGSDALASMPLASVADTTADSSCLRP